MLTKIDENRQKSTKSLPLTKLKIDKIGDYRQISTYRIIYRNRQILQKSINFDIIVIVNKIEK